MIFSLSVLLSSFPFSVRSSFYFCRTPIFIAVILKYLNTNMIIQYSIFMSSWHPKSYARLAAIGATNSTGQNKNRGVHRVLEAAIFYSAYSVLRIKELIKRRLHVLNHFYTLQLSTFDASTTILSWYRPFLFPV